MARQTNRLREATKRGYEKERKETKQTKRKGLLEYKSKTGLKPQLKTRVERGRRTVTCPNGRVHERYFMAGTEKLGTKRGRNREKNTLDTNLARSYVTETAILERASTLDEPETSIARGFAWTSRKTSFAIARRSHCTHH
jgi:hypothetical protein